jgi:hypothetical protein
MNQNQSEYGRYLNSGLSGALAATTLEFVAPKNLDGFLASAQRLYDRGARTFELHASEAGLSLAHEIQSRMAAHLRDVKCVLKMEMEVAKTIRPLAPDAKCDAVFVLESQAEKLSAALMDFVNVPISIVAPITEHYYRQRAAYVITIPKSGTHMLFELLSAFGMINGEQACDSLSLQHYYYTSANHSHTDAHTFFAGLSDLPQGGAKHPLFVTPTLFMYRNPLDVVVSEAFYYGDPTKTSVAYYFSSMSMDERLQRLIGDNPLLGSIRDRMRRYIPWLQLPNVIPVGFEELVGRQGGGSLEEQLKTIWSLQLKLHVPGSPAYYAASVFRRESETFRKGAINSHREYYSEACYAAFRKLNQDFMHELGYDLDDHFAAGYVPRFVDSFRRRPLVVACSKPTAVKKDASHTPEEPLPDAVYAYRGYLAASLGRMRCALPESTPYPLDPRLATGGPHFHLASTWDELFTQLDTDPLADSDSRPRIVPKLKSQDLFQLDPAQPVLAAEDVCGFNIVAFNGRFYCVDHGRGAFDVQWDDTTGVFVARTLEEAIAYCQLHARPRNVRAFEEHSEPVPRLLEEGRRGFNIVKFRGTYFALAQSLGPVDVARIDETWLAARPPHEAMVSQFLVDLTRQIDEISEPVPVVAESRRKFNMATMRYGMPTRRTG